MNRWVGLGALALALVAALWYLSAAPSRGRSVDPGGTAVMASAQQAGAGSWIRYTVTVANYGNLDFEGDVVLLNHGDQPTPDGPSVPNPNQVTKLAGGAGGARFPATAPDAAYQLHIRLPAGKQRQLSVTTPERYEAVEVRSLSGSTLFSGSVEAASAIPVAVLSGSAAVADAVAAVQPGDWPIHAVGVANPRELPAAVAGYGGFAEVLVDQFDSASLSKLQTGALRDFVGLGGTLVLVTGQDWRRTLAGVPAELQPLRPRGTAGVDLAPVADLGRLPGSFGATALEGAPAPGATVLLSDGETPLVAELPYGAGVVLELAFDPASEPVSGTKLAPLAWSLAVGRGLSRTPGTQPAAAALPGPNPIPGDLFGSIPDPPLPSPLVVGVVLLFYLVLVGPVNLYLSRRYRKPDLLWITTPLIAVVCTASFYVTGLAIQGGTRDDQVQVLKSAPAAAATLEYDRLLFHQRGEHVVDLPPGALGAPLTLPLYEASGTGCSRCTLQLSGLPQNVEEHVVNSLPPQIVETGVAYGNVRMVGSVSVRPGKLWLDAQLSARGGRIVGTLRNAGPSAVRDLSLYSYDGEVLHRTFLASSLAPGGSLQVTGTPRPAEQAGSRTSVASPRQLLANSLARTAVMLGDSPVLFGSIDPSPGGLRVDGASLHASATGFLEQPVRLVGADSLLADFERVRLDARTGDARTGYLDVYDFELPPALGTALEIGYDRGHVSGLEVYDWRTGGWRAGPWAEDPSDATILQGALTADEVSNGVVRVRAKEPRTSWGAFLTLGAAR